MCHYGNISDFLLVSASSARNKLKKKKTCPVQFTFSMPLTNQTFSLCFEGKKKRHGPWQMASFCLSKRIL